MIGISIGTSCVPLVADLFLFWYERDFMIFLSVDKDAGIIEALNLKSRYLDIWMTCSILIIPILTV